MPGMKAADNYDLRSMAQLQTERRNSKEASERRVPATSSPENDCHSSLDTVCWKIRTRSPRKLSCTTSTRTIFIAETEAKDFGIKEVTSSQARTGTKKMALFSTISTIFGTFSAPSFWTAISTVCISQVHSPSGEDQGHQITSCFGELLQPPPTLELTKSRVGVGRMAPCKQIVAAGAR